jgi:hypothetical protein
MARATRRVLVTRVKRETLGKYEAEPGRFSHLFTLHGASLRGMWGIIPLKSIKSGKFPK